MKRVLATAIFTIISLASFAQFSKDEDKGIYVSPGVSYQGHLFGEINFMYAQGDGFTFGSCGGDPLLGLRLGITANTDFKHFVYAPKLGYQFASAPIILRGNMLAYVDGKNVDYRFLPEIGLSFIYGSITYGYNCSLSNFMSGMVSRNQITLTFDINTWLID